MSKRYNLRLSDCELIGYGVDTKVKLEYKFSDTLGETRVVSLDDVNDLLNEQDQRITELESNPAFQRVLQLIEERNLTWGAVADILDEHTILLEDVVTDD